MTSPKILLTGSSGMVGHFLASHLGSVQLYTPGSRQLDVTDTHQVHNYFETYTPDIIIHCAAMTDNTAAQRQRGDKKGACWKVNVEGTKNIAAAGKKFGAYSIYISTGSVYSGDSTNPGPFTEDDPPSLNEHLSWYGVTKKEAEKSVSGAIIRLSHPVAKPEIVEVFHPKQDYIQHLVRLFDEHMLYPLFTDQYFPITFLDDVIISIKKLIESRLSGIFHVVSYNTVTPYELAKYAIYKARHVEPKLVTTTFDEFIVNQDNPLRYQKYNAITGAKTAKELQLPVRTWKEIVDEIYEIRNNQ
jgi:dTDP-4-dehydrorhamnose reductase